MQHFIRRCKHCKKQYTYCTYGNGKEYGTEEGCSMDYCAECQKAIDEALSKIPVKFKPILVEIDKPELYPIFEQIKKKVENNKKFPSVVGLMDTGGYDVDDRYDSHFKRYHVRYNEDTPEEKHLYVEKEFDIFENRTTDNYWESDRLYGYFRSVDPFKKFSQTKYVPVNPLSKPVDKLHYLKPVK